MTIEPKLRYFRREHLPAGLLRDVSANFAHLAEIVCEQLPASAERSSALDELKIAKDWAVLAAVDVLDAEKDPTVHAERERVGSPETVVFDVCLARWGWCQISGVKHSCGHVREHGGLHACVECGTSQGVILP